MEFWRHPSSEGKAMWQNNHNLECFSGKLSIWLHVIISFLNLLLFTPWRNILNLLLCGSKAEFPNKAIIISGREEVTSHVLVMSCKNHNSAFHSISQGKTDNQKLFKFFIVKFSKNPNNYPQCPYADSSIFSNFLSAIEDNKTEKMFHFNLFLGNHIYFIPIFSNYPTHNSYLFHWSSHLVLSNMFIPV